MTQPVQKHKSVNRLKKKVQAILEGLVSAARLNVGMIRAKAVGRTTLVVHVGATSQLIHIEPFLEALFSRPSSNQLSFWVLTCPSEFEETRARLKRFPAVIGIGSHRAARLLLACDFMLSVDQGAMYPLIGCKTRACSFHGQPSKGNVYQRFNYQQINTLFVYGPLMRDYYLRTKEAHPEWPEVRLLEVGQPLADRRVNQRIDRTEAHRQLGLDPKRLTLIYAPSFEYCSSLATDGREIIELLLTLELNLIVKPHPAFYNSAPFDDEFNRNCPRAIDWREVICRWGAADHIIFHSDNTLDGDLALAAADVMLTDFSGIAFDGIALDLGMIYWECYRFYDEYLPRRYGVDGASAKTDLACNVGRDCGLVVRNVSELREAVGIYRGNPSMLADERRKVRDQLYFNLGHAGEAMADAVEKLLFGENDDRQ